MSFSVYNNISKPETHTYKLMQLPRELLEYMKTANQPLSFKSAALSNLVLCTDASTYSVRQMKHSNTQLLLNDMAINGTGTQFGKSDPLLVALALCSYLYELGRVAGHVDTTDVPVYNGGTAASSKTVLDVRRDSPIADGAFLPAWHAINGSEVDGKAVLLDSKLVTDVLYVLLSVLKNKEEFSSDIFDLVTEQNPKYTLAVVNTVAHRFCQKAEEKFQIDKSAVAEWFGTETLRTIAGDILDKDFLLEWKSSLPPIFSAPLDIKALRGRFYRPTVGKLKYINLSLLSSDLHTRVKELFQIVGEWDYDEFLPLVTELLPANKKPDAVILKYARKKRVGKRFVVCPR